MNHKPGFRHLSAISSVIIQNTEINTLQHWSGKIIMVGKINKVRVNEIKMKKKIEVHTYTLLGLP